jgi:hypothetical protein
MAAKNDKYVLSHQHARELTELEVNAISGRGTGACTFNPTTKSFDGCS